MDDNARMDGPADQNLDEFVASAEEAADAWVRGDLHRYLDLVHHARGFTLLAPTGGPASRHEDRAGELQGWEVGYGGQVPSWEVVSSRSVSSRSEGREI